ncbi:hypothetical protein KA078_01610 [Candidatus Woesebacteria bacterium]|nr:hypothetical protein [Candidatus Woesebacteria bacterium]
MNLSLPSYKKYFLFSSILSPLTIPIALFGLLLPIGITGNTTEQFNFMTIVMSLVFLSSPVTVGILPLLAIKSWLKPEHFSRLRLVSLLSLISIIAVLLLMVFGSTIAGNGDTSLRSY